MINDFLEWFLCLRANAQVWHWCTKSYAQHKAFGSFYETLDEIFDSFIEKYSARYPLSVDEFSLVIYPFSLSQVKTCLNDFEIFLITELPSLINKDRDTDLLNIRDEILGEINQLRYLLTLE